jgi:hypothetical protein
MMKSESRYELGRSVYLYLYSTTTNIPSYIF